MAFSNVGTLSTTPTHKTGAVSLNNLQDVYQFTVPGPNVGVININASIHDAAGSNPAITPTFRIFRDSNGDGKLITSGVGADTLVARVDSNTPFNEGPINFRTRKGSGTHFAVVDRPNISATDPVSTSYQMDLSATELKLPSNLIPVKLPLGNLTKPNGFSGNINNGNTSDVFSFSLESGKGAQIKLVGLTADADIHIIKDNGDRIFQSNELVTLSTSSGISFESAVVTAPGDYLVQVFQFKGNTNYDLKLNPFNLNGSPFIASQSTPVVFANSAGGTLRGSDLGGILVGDKSKDNLLGQGGDDTLLGGDDNDQLIGGKNDDRLFGGNGNDILKGGTGNDLFVLAAKTGFDTIKDFRDGTDQIGLTQNLTFDQLDFVQRGKGTLVQAGGESLAFLTGVKSNQLTASNFTQIDLAKLTGNLVGLGGVPNA